ncbi:hypothetical protein SPFL3102_00398 [Sporomusaceae bacterium FL31]|nr:hypothetical protein SPFL3101_01890 [Sporomusaceae bacterium FL31]GCE32609.1 hypothetical protein SPFL3102_00398 [Sporomusaceae bacterium]
MKKTIVVLMAIWLLMSVNTGLAMSQEQLENQRNRAEARINSVPEISYDDLLANSDAYYGKVVKVSGECFYFKDNVALLGVARGKIFSISIMTYRFRPDTTYTVVGKFAGVNTTDNGEKWLVILEETHTPFMSEYGL